MHKDTRLSKELGRPRGTRQTQAILATGLPSLVVALTALVHGFSGSQARAWEANPLPVQVAEMRELLLTAARSGNADELKAILDASAVKPDLGVDATADPVAALKAAASDHEGRETLAALSEILELPPVALPLGRDLENNLIYVWPYLAERPLDTLSPAEEIDLYRLAPAGKVTEMREKKRWLWWRLTIGADGSWLSFKKDN